MKAMGYARMEDAFVRSESPLWITFRNGEMEEGGTKLMPVVAVIDDYYPAHLTQGVKPMAFVVGKEDVSGDFIIATKPGKEKEVMELLRKIEKEVYNTEEFNHSWLTDEVSDLYSEDRETAHIYSVFALIAIAISGRIIPVRHPAALSRNSYPQSERSRHERSLSVAFP